MDVRNNKRRNVLTHPRENFSQSETGSLLRGGLLNFELLLWGGGELTEKIQIFWTKQPSNTQNHDSFSGAQPNPIQCNLRLIARKLVLIAFAGI